MFLEVRQLLGGSKHTRSPRFSSRKMFLGGEATTWGFRFRSPPSTARKMFPGRRQLLGPRGGSLDHRARFSLVFLLLHYSTHRTKQARRLLIHQKQLVNVRRSPGEQERPPRFPERHRLVQTESQNREQAQPVNGERTRDLGSAAESRLCLPKRVKNTDSSTSPQNSQ